MCFKKILHKIFKKPQQENVEQEEISDELEQPDALHEAKEIRVSEIMIPRTDVFAMSINSSLEEVKQNFLRTNFMRLFVYNKDLDDIVGFIHLKDVFAYICNGNDGFAVNSFMKKTMYATRSTKCFMLFQKMQQENVETAVILDEYGGIEGVISIERLIEQVLNTIQTSQEEEEESNLTFKQINDNVYLLDGRTSIQKIEELFEDVEFLSEEEGQYETIGGFILSYLDRVPHKGEKFTHDGGLEVEIVDSTSRVIKIVKITRVNNSD